MMQVVTWLSVIILGPGAVTIFIWFLLDLTRVSRKCGSERGASFVSVLVSRLTRGSRFAKLLPPNSLATAHRRTWKDRR
jgi:hypothetical protein